MRGHFLFFLLLRVLVVELSRSSLVAQALVQELTPELEEQLRQRKTKRYFVKIDVGPCPKDAQNDATDENVCQLLDQQFWEPLANMAPREIWTRLDCEAHRNLCNELSTSDRVQLVYDTGRKVDFMTVAYSPNSPTRRVVERYFAKHANMEELYQYLQEMIVGDLPFEPMAMEDVSGLLDRSNIPTATRKPVALAVLVLTTDGFAFPDVWEAFLKSGTDVDHSVRLFIHDKSASKDAFSSNEQNTVVHVPPIFTHRGTISLARPVIQMLRFALTYGGASHYALVSGDSVPLLSAADLIQELESPKEEGAKTTTRFERHAQDEFKVDMDLRQRYQGDFLKSKNWVVFDNETAHFFASHDYTYNFEMMSMADEYYFINVAQEYNVSWQNLPVMYDVWPDVQAERPNTLKQVNAAKMRSKGHLFARTVTRDTELVLDWMSNGETKQRSPKDDL